jgi:organic hydroperoxide reductase OsmC/OhrA
LVLGAAVAGCLASSLSFCLRKSHVDLHGVTVHVSGSHGRNEQGRLRVTKLDVTIVPTVAPQDRDRLGRCEELFEDFCVVTEAVRHGIEVDVRIEPRVEAT